MNFYPPARYPELQIDLQPLLSCGFALDFDALVLAALAAQVDSLTWPASLALPKMFGSDLHVQYGSLLGDDVQRVATLSPGSAVCVFGSARDEMAVDMCAETAQKTVADLIQAGMLVSACVLPELVQVQACAQNGMSGVALYAAALAHSSGEPRQTVLHDLRHAGIAAKRLGLNVYVRGDIDLHTATELAQCPEFSRICLGTQFVSNMLMQGAENAMRLAKAALVRAVHSGAQA